MLIHSKDMNLNLELYKGTIEEIEDHLNSELNTNSDLYFFCLRRNKDFLSELERLKNDFSFLNPFFSPNFVHKPKKLGRKYANSLLQDVLNINFIDLIHLPPHSLCEDTINYINIFCNSYKCFSFKWKVEPPFEINKPYVLIKPLANIDFNLESTYISLDDESFYIKSSLNLHPNDSKLFAKELANIQNKKNKPRLDNVLHSLRAYKIHEDHNFKNWPDRTKIQTLLFGQDILNYSSEDYFSRLSKLESKAKDYITDPFLILKSITS